MKKILITGGAGYVGSALVPKLLKSGYAINVIDLMIYGETLPEHENLQIFRSDIRDIQKLKASLEGVEAVIHLACISNDPSFELDKNLGKKINFDIFEPMVKAAIQAGVKRFIYASSSSVYGVKSEPNVSENMSLEPLTDYSKFKAMCEEILIKYKSEDFTPIVIRPATVCGFSPRQRLDLVVNILSNLAFNKKKITVFGGPQLRPNIHIDDMVDAYLLVLESPKEKVSGEIYNVGYENQPVSELALAVKSVVGKDVEIITQTTNDNRSYHISSEKIFNDLGFKAKKTVKNAVEDLIDAFKKNKFQDPLSNDNYFNIKKMQKIKLK
jgi:nucleoside-diphosphate-sugar epimerase